MIVADPSTYQYHECTFQFAGYDWRWPIISAIDNLGCSPVISSSCSLVQAL